MSENEGISDERDLEVITKFFELGVRVDHEIVDFLADRLIVKTFSARELITEAGRQERYFYIVQEGVQGLYLINSSGDKVVLAFSFAGSPSGVYDSFIREKPSSLFLEALRPSRMYALSKPAFDQLFIDFPKMTHWKAQFFESILLGRLSREVELLTMSAKERYDVFVARCPPPLLSIPQKYLASYLNMTPETFSRLRSVRD